jgi:hypothetical protein
MTWTGWDGSVWSLSDSQHGTVMLPGVRGLNMPGVTHYTTTNANLPGARWRGHTTDVREVFWPIQIYSNTGSVEWLARDRAFWKTMRPEKTGTWSVIQPDGQSRSLKLRFQDDGTQTFDTDPAIVGWTNYGITLQAEEPYWAGPSEIRSWTAGNAVPFFPNLTISPGGTLASAQIVNPGDVDIWPVWKIHGPSTTAQVGLNGRLITVPFTVNAGQVLTIDTSPRVQTAMLDGVDRTADLGTVDFAPIPADGTTTLSLSMTGTGSISATITPLYLRAW